MTDTSDDLFAGLSMAPAAGSPPKPNPKQDAAKHSIGASDNKLPMQPQLPLKIPGAETAERAFSDSVTPGGDPPPAASPPERVRSAPVTDKLLGLLGPTSAGSTSSQLTTTGASSSEAKVNSGAASGGKNIPGRSTSTPSSKPAANGSMNSAQGPPTADIPESVRRLVSNEEIMAAFNLEAEHNKAASQASGSSRPRRGSENQTSGTPAGRSEDVLSTVRTTPRGAGVVHPDTPIPSADVALRLFRKFAKKTRVQVPESYGGTQKLSIMRFLFGSTIEQDRKFQPYQQLMNLIVDHNGKIGTSNDEEKSDSDRIVESGDTMEKARKALAAFCNLMSVWGHASAHMAESDKNSSSHRTFSDILAAGLDTATALVTHGCLDGVKIGIGPNHDEYHKAIDMLAESVFASDLSMERNELAAMKFLLSTGCRVTAADGDAMLRGTHLLQTIRVLYHVYLTTVADSNKTTARASLQQLVTSVFIRMIATSPEDGGEEEKRSDEEAAAGANNESFPSANHRDAFLVLRSLCKLSMRSPPSDPKMHSHVGLQSSGSNTMWDSKDAMKSPTERGAEDFRSTAATPDALHQHKEQPHLIYTQAIHPALESKILALDLLLYVLQNTAMKGTFLYQCGPQFHYAIRHYLCVSLLKNCTSDDTRVVNLSLMVFVPIIRNFRSILKAEIEAFVTNVFFVILDSKNSSIEHKLLVVTLFEEICSDPTTLAEIFLNYDCDLSAVDLFHRIVNTLSKVSRTTEVDDGKSSSISLVAGAGAARMEKSRSDHRELRLEAMKALRHVLASLHARIVEPMDATDAKNGTHHGENKPEVEKQLSEHEGASNHGQAPPSPLRESGQQTLVQIYDSKKKRREEESEVVLRFNQKPSAGISYAAKCGHLAGSDATDVARWLLKNKDTLEKTQIGEYLGREPEYQNGFSLKVLHEYVNMMDFVGLLFDEAIRFYLSGFRLPGEAQKIDRIMEKFAERYTAQNPDVFPTADVAFILAFSIIMLNTDLHNPAIKEERRMTKQGFIRNNRGICDGQDLPPEFLNAIFDRIKANPISLKEDDEARERAGDPSKAGGAGAVTSLPSALSPAVFFTSHYEEMDRTKETNFLKERDQIVRTTESLLKRRRHTGSGDHGKSHRRRPSSVGSRQHAVRYVRTEDSGLRDEYVSPMFEVTWGPALAAFSTAMESANGTVGALLAIATDEELELAAENAAETIEVCLTGFRFAICTAGLCGNSTARDAFMLALARFSQLGTGVLLEPRHCRCMQTMLDLARSDGELLGSSWEHVFKALSEINRFHQLFQLLARNDRVIAIAAERRKSRLEERERRHRERQERRAAKENSDALDDLSTGSLGQSEGSFGDSELFSDDDDFLFDDEMDKRATDEANARTVYEAVSEGLIEAIYERSSSLSTAAVTEFVLQLCRVSRMEISHYGGHVGSDANTVDLTQVHYRQHHTLLTNSPTKDPDGFHHHQPNIYNLQKLVEVTHYNMDSRPRLVFADLWTTVAAHLTSTALHSNSAVAMYAVDSFRQLSIQYLQREELGVFEFQRRFLKPLETVMARSDLATTKELLLKCIERIILMFGSGEGSRGGMLRSGWRPILAVLGLAGRDQDEAIAKLGFAMLTGQLEHCLSGQKEDVGEEKASPGVLLAERFVDLVDALLVYVGGPHEQMSLVSLDHLETLSAFLADKSLSLPLIKKRATTATAQTEGENTDGKENNQELELWWPILLGISRSVGDARKSVRLKSLETLLKIVNSHFFPSEEASTAEGPSQLQTLQLVFRGILTPVLEFGEVDDQGGRPPQLPEDFDRFMTAPEEDGDKFQGLKSSWQDTTFDQFMDGCISVCLRSIKVFDEDTLVEEIFAMLNSCLLSDSGSLAVRGLRCLEQFVTSDLKQGMVTDDTWATISHMLRRCLELRGLPRSSSTRSLNGSVSSGQRSKDSNTEDEASDSVDDQEAIREFVVEDNMLANRRFVGSNAIMVIGSLLGSNRFSRTLGLRWRLFLVSGVARALRDWEKAASILAEHGGSVKARGHNPPHYLETAHYGRKWMNLFLLQLASSKELSQPGEDGSRQTAAQALMKDQTQSLVSAYLEKEDSLARAGKRTADGNGEFARLTSLLKDMFAGYEKLPDEQLRLMAWLNPVLSSCIHTRNESLRLAIQKLVRRLHVEP